MQHLQTLIVGFVSVITLPDYRCLACDQAALRQVVSLNCIVQRILFAHKAFNHKDLQSSNVLRLLCPHCFVM